MKHPSSKIVNLAMVFSLSGVGKVLGMVRDLVLTSRFGAGVLTDAFYVSFNFPFLLSIFSGMDGINGTSTSLLAKSKLKTENKFNHDFSAIAYCILIYGTLISGIAFFLAKPILYIIIPGFSADAFSTTYELVLRFVPLILILTLFRYFNIVFGVLNAFLFQNIGELILAVTMVTVLIFISTQNFTILPHILVLAFSGVVVIQLHLLKKVGVYFRPVKAKFLYYKIIFLVKMVAPLLLVTATFQIAKVVDSAIASYFDSGAITVINLSSHWATFLVVFIIEVFMKIYYPSFSNAYHGGDLRRLDSEFNQVVTFLLALMVPISVFFFWHPRPIMELIFYRGNFDLENLEMLGQCFKIYSLALTLGVLYLVPTYVMLATQNNKLLGVLGLISFSTNIIASIIFSLMFGYIGIPLGTIFALILYGSLLNRAIKNKFGVFISYKNMKGVSLVFGLSLISILGINLIPLQESKLYSFIIKSIVYFLVAFGLSALVFRKLVVHFITTIKQKYKGLYG